eukprot:scaffold2376_cov115-Isochrysis_galbana.AAC.1
MHVRRGRRGGAQEAVALKDSSHGPVGFEEFASSVAVEAPDGDSARATQIQVHVQGDVRVALGLEEVRPLESRIVVDPPPTVDPVAGAPGEMQMHGDAEPAGEGPGRVGE